MGARAVLAEMADLVRVQTQAVIDGDTKALVSGTARHEELLAALATAEVDLPDDELRAICQELDQAKVVLQSLLAAGLTRTDFLLRLMLRGGEPRKSGYGSASWPGTATAQRINRRT